MKENDVIVKLLFLISVHEFPLLLWYYYKCLIVLNWTEINLLGLLNVFLIHLKLKLKYFPFTMLTWWSMLIWQDTSHYKVTILLFHDGDLVSLITYKGLFWIKLCIVLIRKKCHWYFKVLRIYIVRM